MTNNTKPDYSAMTPEALLTALSTGAVIGKCLEYLGTKLDGNEPDSDLKETWDWAVGLFAAQYEYQRQAAAAEAVSQAGWQPIETAPTNGISILVWNGITQIGYRNDHFRNGERAGLWFNSDTENRILGITKWQHLPEPPSADKPEVVGHKHGCDCAGCEAYKEHQAWL